MQVRDWGEDATTEANTTNASNATTNTSNTAAGNDIADDSKVVIDTLLLDAMMLEPVEAVAKFKAMLHDANSSSVAKGLELDNIPLRQLMKKKGKERGDSLKCQGSPVSKSGIKLGRNRRKVGSSGSFSVHATLTDYDDMTARMTAHDKEVLREIGPLFEGITGSHHNF